MADKTLVCNNFMLKKVLITNHKDAQIAEKQEKQQEEILIKIN